MTLRYLCLEEWKRKHFPLKLFLPGVHPRLPRFPQKHLQFLRKQLSSLCKSSLLLFLPFSILPSYATKLPQSSNPISSLPTKKSEANGLTKKKTKNKQKKPYQTREVTLITFFMKKICSILCTRGSHVWFVTPSWSRRDNRPRSTDFSSSHPCCFTGCAALSPCEGTAKKEKTQPMVKQQPAHQHLPVTRNYVGPIS